MSGVTEADTDDRKIDSVGGTETDNGGAQKLSIQKEHDCLKETVSLEKIWYKSHILSSTQM